MGRKNSCKFYEFEKENVLAIKSKNNDIYITDLDDKEKIEKYSWGTSTNGYPCIHKFYKDENGFGKYKYTGLNRYILNETDPNICVDHKTRNKFDNRKSNLRRCTHQQNDCNKIKKNQKRDMIGIRIKNNVSSKKYSVRITVNQKEIHLGTFDTLEEATKIRKEAEEKYFGDFIPGLYESDGTYERICYKIKGLISPFTILENKEDYIINPFSTLVDDKINPFTFLSI